MNVATERTCPDCQGTGAWIKPDDCSTCGGRGAIPAAEHDLRQQVALNAHLALKDAERCRNCGQLIRRTVPSDDLDIEWVHVPGHGYCVLPPLMAEPVPATDEGTDEARIAVLKAVRSALAAGCTEIEIQAVDPGFGPYRQVKASDLRI